MKTTWPKCFALFAGVLFATMNAQAQQGKAPIEVVQAQLDAYNKQDVEAFTAVFAPNAMLFQNLGDSVPSHKGQAEIRHRYADLFKKYPNNKCTLLGRMVQGNHVIDHELITGREQEMRIVAIYEVKDGLIARCWFAR
jgi:hypothetical protein